ncbi:MAG: family 16 glycosylhydrolase, partial [Clostridia bacterium]
MRKKLRVIAVIVALFACASMLDGCIKSPKAGTSMDLSGMEIVFQDDFDAPILDATKWTTARYNTTNDSPIRRGGYWDGDQVTFDGANLIITTEYLADGKHGAGWYTGMVNSNNIQEFRYGYYEVRCKAPKAEGLWSAFWLQADDIAKVTGDGKNGTEIDILETPFWNDVKSGKKL